MQDDCFAKPDFSSTGNVKIKLDHIGIEYDHILPFTGHKLALFDSGLFIKLRT